MSAQSIITLDNLPTDVAMDQYMATASLDLLKYLRFGVGCVDHTRIKEMLRLKKFVCGNFCYIDDEQDRLVREAVIRGAINEIYDI
jgi:hypothetical protein